ncbi:MAG: 50S ribosomal protein L11 methyltransferase [Myxococcota bacterium]|nr:50S ribosomal protein L11 methyltransferase [Myxococcota bacterium]
MIAPNVKAFGRPLTLQRPALCPEFQLWLLDAQIDLEAACREIGDCHPPPYWAFCWGAGQALARFLIDHPETVAGQRVVDWGTGSGIAAIAAARSGASAVTAVDHDPAALLAAQRNAHLNRVELVTASRLPEEFDVLLAADVLYEQPVLSWLQGQCRGGRRVLVADPLRATTPKLGGPPIGLYAVQTQPDVDSPINQAAVFDLPPVNEGVRTDPG